MALLASWPQATEAQGWWRWKYTLLALLVLATYPVALLGHFAVDLLLGDRQMLRELQHGYTRLLAASLLRGFAWSLIPVAGLWLMLRAAVRLLPSLHGVVASACAALAAVLALTTAFPPLLAWLVAAAVLLHGVYELFARRPSDPPS